MDHQQHTHDHPPLGGAIGGGAECLACPICVVLQAVAEARPEVLGHVAAAGRELALAVQALLGVQPPDRPAADDRPADDRPADRPVERSEDRTAEARRARGGPRVQRIRVE